MGTSALKFSFSHRSGDYSLLSTSCPQDEERSLAHSFFQGCPTCSSPADKFLLTSQGPPLSPRVAVRLMTYLHAAVGAPHTSMCPRGQGSSPKEGRKLQPWSQTDLGSNPSSVTKSTMALGQQPHLPEIPFASYKMDIVVQ